MKKKLTCLLIFAFMATAIVPCALAQDAIVFNDVNKDSPQGKAIYKMVDARYVNGYSDSTFRPDNPVTRAEFVKMVNLVFGFADKGNLSGFSDVKEGQWFYDNVMIAQNKGYINGFPDKTFRPDENVTREQVCKILNELLDFEMLPFDGEITDTVSPWALDSVKKVISNRVFILGEDGKFRAAENATRAEVCEALVKFIVQIPEIPEEPEKPGEDEGTGGGGGSVSEDDYSEQMERVISRLDEYVIPKLSTDAQKEIVEDVKVNMTEYIKDNNYDYKSAAKVTYEKYKALSEEEQKELKNLVQLYNSTDDLLDLYKFFFQK